LIEGLLRRLAIAVIACSLMISALGETHWAAAQTPRSETTAAGAAAPHQSPDATQQPAEVTELSQEVHEIRTLEHWVLAPIGFLVGILALGGGFGIVFSIRDQRRVSQLHELTVGSEVLSQRRTEQGYASFLAQSQTTLALVNDTLRLAKEGSEGAAHSMALKTESQIDAIEERAERLMFDVFGTREFQAIVERPEFRAEAHSIGEAVRALEGYANLQEIKIPVHTKFVKAIEQFLLDDTEPALQGLRRISQGRLSDELRRFTFFWLGYLYTTVGVYEPAAQIFREDEKGLADYSERFQLEHMIAETHFFEKTTERRHGFASIPTQVEHEPQARFAAVAPALDELSSLAADVATAEEAGDLGHVPFEITRTRADVYTWIAYDPTRVDKPLEHDVVAKGEELAEETPLEDQSSASALMQTRNWEELTSQSPDVFRAWALVQARKICESRGKPDFDLAFALAECHFMLGSDLAADAFEQAERTLSGELGDHREKRKKATLAQSALICHSRLYHHRRTEEERRQVALTASRAHEAIDAMRPGRVTVFSQLQRCNVNQDEFRSELRHIVEQLDIDGPT
jgi:hypothetical protein